MRRSLALFLGLLMLLTTLPTAAYAEMGNAEQGSAPLELEGEIVSLIPLDAAHFPDSHFCDYLATFDADGDEALSQEERQAVTEIDCTKMSIGSLAGLEYFENLTVLDCDGNALTTLDVSDNPALTYLYCDSNALTALDVSHNPLLTELDCAGNALTELDVSGNPALTTLYCYKNALTTLDVSANPALTYLDCDDNKLTTLDMSGNPALTYLYCFGNELTTLDVSHNPELSYLDCNGNKLMTLDVSHNPALTMLRCSTNALTALDVSGNPELTYLYCNSNALTELDVSANPALTTLRCYSNALTELDVSHNPELSYLDCDGNALTTLDVSDNPALTYLYCDSNALTALDVSHNPLLTELDCAGNALTELDVSGNPALTTLYCFSNALTALDASHNPKLESLDCNANALTVLDVSANPALVRLECGGNKLTALDVSVCTKLETLYCGSGIYVAEVSNTNTLTELDVTKNPALVYLECDDNALTELDVSANPLLTVLNCAFNALTELDVSQNQMIKYFACCGNKLTELDVSHNTMLEWLSCFDNDLTVLDVSANPSLTSLLCSGNALTELDVSGNPALDRIDCASNALTALDVSHNPALWQLTCDNNALTTLDVSQTPVLSELKCNNNKLTTLDVSGNPALTYLDCNNNKLTTLDVSENPELVDLYCGGNALTGLDLSALTALNALDCSDNRLSALDTTEMTTIEDWEGVEITPQVFYDGNPLTDVKMGAAVRIGHEAVDEPLNANDGIRQYIRSFSFDDQYIITTSGTAVTDYHADGTKTEWLCYRPDPMVTLTFNQTGINRFGCKTLRDTVSGLRERGITGIYVTSNQSADAPWCAGKTYSCTLHVEKYDDGLPSQTSVPGAKCNVSVEIVEGRIASIAPATADIVPLIENWDGWWSEDDGTGIFRYGLFPWYTDEENTPYFEENTRASKLEYTVTFTPTGAASYGCNSFTGTLEEIYDLTGLLGEYVFAWEDGAVWEVNSSHTARLDLGGKSCQIQMQVVESPIRSMAPVLSGPLLLIENMSGYWQQDGTEFTYDVARWQEQLRYIVVFSEEGAARYGRHSFVGTLPELAELIGERGQFDGEQWFWDSAHDCLAYTPWEQGIHTVTLNLMGKSCRIPLQVVESPLAEVALVEQEPMALQRGLDGYWRFDDTEDGKEGHFYYDFLDRRVWNEAGQYWGLPLCQVVATFTDAGMAHFGVARSGEYDIYELVNMQPDSYVERVGEEPGENWAVGEKHTLTLSLLGKTLTVPVEIAAPRVELEALSLETSETNTFAADIDPEYLFSNLNYRVTYKEAGDQSTTTATMSGWDMLYRWGIEPQGCTDKPDDQPWEAGKSCQITVGCADKLATATVVPRKSSGSVALTEANFPDEAFLRFLKEEYDQDGDGLVPVEQVCAMWVYGEDIKSLEGIELFTELMALDLSGNAGFKALDVSNCTSLMYISCNSDALETLDASGCTALRELSCADNALKTLNVSGCTSLLNIDCTNNALKTLDVTDCSLLRYIDCTNNALAALNVTKNTSLRALHCADNALAALDVRKNTALEALDCSLNKLTALDVTKNTSLRALYCADNALAALDVRKNASLEELDCSLNKLTALDVTKNTALVYLRCGDMAGLAELDASMLASLTSLDVSGCPLLRNVYLHHQNGLWLNTFGASASLQIAVGGKPLEKKNVIAGNSSLGDDKKPVELHFESKDSQDTFDAVTDNTAAIFGDLAGKYLVTVSKEGYVPRTFDIDITVTAGEGVNVKIVQRGDLNGIAGADQTDRVDTSDCQRIYEVLNGESPLETDDNLVGNEEAIQYAQQVADANEDGILNILDYQSLYEDVVSRRGENG